MYDFFPMLCTLICYSYEYNSVVALGTTLAMKVYNLRHEGISLLPVLLA